MRDYKIEAIDQWNKGFTSKASKKDALQKLNYSYSHLREDLHYILLTVDMDTRKMEVWNELYWGSPSDLHCWREKHSILFGELFEEIVEEIEVLFELRTAMKETEVVPPVKIETPEQIKANKVEKTIEEIMEGHKERFLNGYSLTEEFGGLEVTANSHWGMNQHGTQFIRTFYYLFGKVTALNTICAIAGKHKDEHPELYPDEEVK